VDKKYDVIVIDPPWKLTKITHKERPNQVNMDYPMMSMQEIQTLPISDIANENCWCFMWTIQKYLYESPAILKAWGFNLLLTMVWEKTYGRSAGMPLYGFRWNGEFILVGYKAKPSMWPKRSLIPAVFSAENIRHSQKPDRFYKMIEPLGDNRIDIFARQKREGWDVWGNEVESDIQLL
jgi:N6-adenosine-specific RNA methylase IME4